ncbi:endonuclease domain-containing protein [Phenylobacterium sp.]|jgi:leucyl-tRNA synthetase|uniref:endonuclease domain-containing protein n=1 Tax=Phenylobacterium sp. TaxID=1871053 RepID=UPI002F936546
MAKVRSTRSALLLKRARSMRREPTRAEARLWEALRGKRLGELKWRRQAPVGPFIADFVCYAARLVVELDGEAHEGRATGDADRTMVLDTFGFRVVRFSNDEVLGDLGGVCERILTACGGERPPLGGVAATSAPPSPCPLPLGGGV